MFVADQYRLETLIRHKRLLAEDLHGYYPKDNQPDMIEAYKNLNAAFDNLIAKEARYLSEQE